MRSTRCLRIFAALILGAAVSSCGGGGGSGGGGVQKDATPRLHQLYVFRSPANANNTVFVVTLNPRAGVDQPTTFSTDQAIRLFLDTNADGTADLSFEATFGAADSGGVQPVTLRLGGTVFAQGNTRQNLPVTVGGLTFGTFRAGLADDPFFLDKVGLDQFLAGGAFPRPVGTATNFFGPSGNCLALVLEFASSSIAATNTVIDVWATTTVEGVQNDRLGRPLTLELLIPPVPTGSTPDRRAAFLANTQPSMDLALFGADVRAVLTGFYARTVADANAIANLFLPDVTKFQIGNPNGFGTFVAGPAGTVLGNGRRLRDDTTDILVNIFTNGARTTDNVPDDNGTRVTDGNLGTVAAFPYIGAPN